MKAAKRQLIDAPLCRADFVVRAARGHQRPDGGIAWSGMLFVRDVPVASFRNDGDGGCCVWIARTPAMLADVEAFAKTEFPTTKFEQLDHFVGQLWDAAYSKQTVMS